MREVVERFKQSMVEPIDGDEVHRLVQRILDMTFEGGPDKYDAGYITQQVENQNTLIDLAIDTLKSMLDAQNLSYTLDALKCLHNCVYSLSDLSPYSQAQKRHIRDTISRVIPCELLNHLMSPEMGLPIKIECVKMLAGFVYQSHVARCHATGLIPALLTFIKQAPNSFKKDVALTIKSIVFKNENACKLLINCQGITIIDQLARYNRTDRLLHDNIQKIRASIHTFSSGRGAIGGGLDARRPSLSGSGSLSVDSNVSQPMYTGYYPRYNAHRRRYAAGSTMSYAARVGQNAADMGRSWRVKPSSRGQQNSLHPHQQSSYHQTVNTGQDRLSFMSMNPSSKLVANSANNRLMLKDNRRFSAEFMPDMYEDDEKLIRQLWSPNPVEQKKSFDTIRSILSSQNRALFSSLVNKNVMSFLIRLLDSDKNKEIAAALELITQFCEKNEACVAYITNLNVVEKLVQIVTSQALDHSQLIDAFKCLSMIAHNKMSRDFIYVAGGVEVLVSKLVTYNDEFKKYILKLLIVTLDRGMVSLIRNKALVEKICTILSGRNIDVILSALFLLNMILPYDISVAIDLLTGHDLGNLTSLFTAFDSSEIHISALNCLIRITGDYRLHHKCQAYVESIVAMCASLLNKDDATILAKVIVLIGQVTLINFSAQNQVRDLGAVGNIVKLLERPEKALQVAIVNCLGLLLYHVPSSKNNSDNQIALRDAIPLIARFLSADYHDIIFKVAEVCRNLIFDNTENQRSLGSHVIPLLVKLMGSDTLIVRQSVVHLTHTLLYRCVENVELFLGNNGLDILMQLISNDSDDVVRTYMWKVFKSLAFEARYIAHLKDALSKSSIDLNRAEANPQVDTHREKAIRYFLSNAEFSASMEPIDSVTKPDAFLPPKIPSSSGTADRSSVLEDSISESTSVHDSFLDQRDCKDSASESTGVHDSFLDQRGHSGEKGARNNIADLPYGIDSITYSPPKDDASADMLGKGSFGKVFRVKLPDMGGYHALKRCNGPEGHQNLIAEMSILNMLRHTSIITIHKKCLDRTGALIGYIMDYCSEGSLHQYLSRLDPAKQESAWSIGVSCQISQGLGHIHGKGIVHRDIKSINILMYGAQPKIADFGLAARLSDRPGFAGTPRWMAPELLVDRDAAFTKACDIYSLAMVVYEIVTHQYPWKQQLDKVSTKHIKQQLLVMFRKDVHVRPGIESRVAVPEGYSMLIQRCWDPTADMRPDACSIIEDLDKLKISL